MPQPVDGGDGDETGHQVRRHGAGLGSGAVEPDDEEADGDVQSLAGDLVLVHKRPPVSVNGDEAERTGATAEVAPAPSRGGRLGRSQMAVCRRGQPSGCRRCCGHDTVLFCLGRCCRRLGHARHARFEGGAASCTGSSGPGTGTAAIARLLLHRLLRRGLSSTPGHGAHVILHVSF